MSQEVLLNRFLVNPEALLSFREDGGTVGFFISLDRFDHVLGNNYFVIRPTTDCMVVVCKVRPIILLYYLT